MLTFALFGAGRIGRLHAANIVAHPKARLGLVAYVAEEAAQAVAAQHGASVGSV